MAGNKGRSFLSTVEPIPEPGGSRVMAALITNNNDLN